jgi:hypothetical protein
MKLASVGVEMKWPPGNSVFCFWTQGQIRHFVLPLYPNEAHKSGCEQLYILVSAEATTRPLENQSK